MNTIIGICVLSISILGTFGAPASILELGSTTIRSPFSIDEFVTVTKSPLECFCTKEKIPVCDIFGQQFDNECLMTCMTGSSSTSRIACRARCPCNTPVSLPEAIPHRPSETTQFSDSFNFTDDASTEIVG